jgi:predicted nucleotidyltransferase
MDRETARIAKNFAQKVKKMYAPAKVILFGSRARGDHLKRSDFDFLIISPKFAKQPFIYRSSELYKFWTSPVDVEPLCYTPEEFERKKKQNGIVQEALKEGIEISSQ